jgi:hypothetical protein
MVSFSGAAARPVTTGGARCILHDSALMARDHASGARAVLAQASVRAIKNTPCEGRLPGAIARR